MDEIGRGAAVAIDPRTGGVLAMTSRPSFDPNEFALGLSSERWNEIVDDRSFPLLNRAVQSAYPPASTYKILISLGALGDGIPETLPAGHLVSVREHLREHRYPGLQSGGQGFEGTKPHRHRFSRRRTD